MKFVGIRRVFSTENEEQYVTIGAFWDGIYKDGPLLYEIEEFDDKGNCKIMKICGKIRKYEG